MTSASLHIYAVCFTKYDSTTQLHGCLSNIRKNYFESGVSEKQVLLDERDGISTKYSYYISHWGMGWKKYIDHHLVEYSVPEQSGTAIFFQDYENRPYAKAIYDSNLDWKSTQYFDPDTGLLAHTLELLDDRGVMLLQEYRQDGSLENESKLYPGYSDIHSKTQDVLNEKSGTPMIYASTSRGEVCFCTAQQAKRRCDVMEDLEPEITAVSLEDMMVPTFDWDKRGAQLFAECVLLLRGADPEEQEDEVRAVMETVSQDGENIREELSRTIQETEAWLAQLKHSASDEDSELQELYSYSQAEAYENDADVAEIMALINGMEEPEAAKTVGVSLQKELESLRKAGKPMPSRYMVAGKKKNAKPAHAADVFDGKHHHTKAV